MFAHYIQNVDGLTRRVANDVPQSDFIPPIGWVWIFTRMQEEEGREPVRLRPDDGLPF